MLFSRRVERQALLSVLAAGSLILTACGVDDPAGPTGCTSNCSARISSAITANRTLKADTVYTLSGYVRVENGATLTIEPGTKIVGDTTVAGSSLYVMRGAKLIAEGTLEKPIVFTSARAAGNRRPGDWGGIVLVGNGVVNRTGVTTEGPAEVNFPYSGGTNDSDNSGSLRYVRIEFAGYATVADAELNSLSSYAVGRGTKYEYIQSMAGLDDSFEWWGGAVDGRYLVSYEAGDDHFDWTEGYKGRNQFLIAFQSQVIQPRTGAGFPSVDPQGFEGDGCNGTGCTLGFASTPFSMPVFANFTMIGTGPGVVPTGGGIGMMIRRGTGGLIFNGVVARWPNQGLTIRDAFTDTLRQRDSLVIRNVVFAENAANFDAASSANFGKAAVFTGNNIVENTGTAASLVTSLTPSSLDWTPSASSAIRTAGTTTLSATSSARVQNFFGASMTLTAYAGAADPGASTKWWSGWTVYITN